MFILLWGGAIYALFHLARVKYKLFVKFNLDGLKFIVKRFIFFAVLLTLFTLVFSRETLFMLPKTHFKIWVLVMILYPLFSAFFQEILFRAFFTLRYKFLFKNELSFVLINALIFGAVHLLYGNFIAVIFSFFGGLMFMKTYLKSGSVVLSTIEHALYGNFIFTIGLGRYFYNG
ncbi:MAG: CPBP family intramembrane metalloprotease [Campylobacteraceae bacterium]|nr:CPBP family intramembrane metalloprotease [Campylobacteraceae bacterium]